MAERVRTLRLAVIAVVTTVALASIGQFVWPQAIAWIGAEFLNALREAHDLGWVGVVLVFSMVTCSGVLPASLIGMSAGAVYGVTLGFVISSTSILIGAVIAFLLSRSFLRPLIERNLGDKPRLSSLDGQIGHQGWRFVCLLRLSPVMPFAATSYALGLTSIRLGEYLAGTLASLPSLLVYVLTGTVVKTGVSSWNGHENSIRIALLVLGALSTAVVMIQMANVLRRAAPASKSSVARRGTRFTDSPVPSEPAYNITSNGPGLVAERNSRG